MFRILRTLHVHRRFVNIHVLIVMREQKCSLICEQTFTVYEHHFFLENYDVGKISHMATCTQLNEYGAGLIAGFTPFFGFDACKGYRLY